jgi:hypothetical protein
MNSFCEIGVYYITFSHEIPVSAQKTDENCLLFSGDGFLR